MLVFQRAETIRVTSSHLLLKASYTQSRQFDSHYPCLLVRFSKKKESPQKFFNLWQSDATFHFHCFAMLFRYNPPNVARIDIEFKIFCLSLRTAGVTDVFARSIT